MAVSAVVVVVVHVRFVAVVLVQKWVGIGVGRRSSCRFFGGRLDIDICSFWIVVLVVWHLVTVVCHLGNRNIRGP